jgi:hypothetical protein
MANFRFRFAPPWEPFFVLFRHYYVIFRYYFSRNGPGEAGIVPLYTCSIRLATVSFCFHHRSTRHETLWFAVRERSSKRMAE